MVILVEENEILIVERFIQELVCLDEVEIAQSFELVDVFFYLTLE